LKSLNIKRLIESISTSHQAVSGEQIHFAADADQDGKVTVDEFLQLVQSQPDLNMDLQIAKNIFHTLDENSDGSLSKDEITKFTTAFVKNMDTSNVKDLPT